MKKDERKTKAQLIEELEALRQRVAKLEASEPEYKRMGEALKHLEERFRNIFEYAPDAYYLNDLAGNFVDGNKAAEETIGYKREELIGKNFLELNLLSPDQLSKAAALLAQNAQGHSTGPDELVLNRKDGSQVPVEIRTFPVTIQGQVLVLGIARDITARKRMEEVIKESEERYRSLFQNANDGIATLTLEGIITSMNPGLEIMLDRSSDEAIGKHYGEFLTPSSLALVEERIRRTLAGQKLPSIFEVEVVRRDGSVALAEARTRLIRDQEGKPIGFQGIYRDITERKRMEAALRESERRYRHLVENSLGLISTHDLGGRLLSINPAAARSLGYHEDEAVGLSVREALAPAMQPFFDAYLERIRQNPTDSGLMRVITKTGEERIWAYRNVRYEEPGQPVLRVGTRARYHRPHTGRESAAQSARRVRSQGGGADRGTVQSQRSTAGRNHRAQASGGSAAGE